MIQTKFELKPEQKVEFEEGKIKFVIENNSKKKKRIKIEIKD